MNGFSPRVVAIGGGTGLPIVLHGLRELLFPAADGRLPEKERERLTAIVTVADDGRSSGRLRRAHGIPAPGDARNCLIALAEEDNALRRIFDFRFAGGAELAGHSMGNLILAGLAQMEAGFAEALERAGAILGIRGRVFPSTPEPVTLQAEFQDGSRIEGESWVALARRPIRRIRQLPEAARALPGAVEAVAAADLITIGPGSLYTSLLPVLLVRDLAAAVCRCRARIVLVMNLMTEPGETDGFTGPDFVRALRHHVPRIPIHDVLVNRAPIPAGALARHRRDGSVPIRAGRAGLEALGCRVVERDLLGTGPRIRHDPRVLGRALLDLVPGAHRRIPAAAAPPPRRAAAGGTREPWAGPVPGACPGNGAGRVARGSLP